MRLFNLFLIILFLSCNNRQEDKKTPESSSLNTSEKSGTNAHASDSLILGERIDGPANIRDTANGKLSFTLNNNIVVVTTAPQKKWLQVGVIVDLTQEQLKTLLIKKGSLLFVEGEEIGSTNEDVHLQGAFETNEGLGGELVGYTSISNIKSNTIPENVLAEIINSASSSLKETDFKQYIANFQFSQSNELLPGMKVYKIDENWIDDPSPLLRILLLFKDEKFVGIIHSRPLNIKNAVTKKLKRGFSLTAIQQDTKQLNEVVQEFNSMIVQVD